TAQCAVGLVGRGHGIVQFDIHPCCGLAADRSHRAAGRPGFDGLHHRTHDALNLIGIQIHDLLPHPPWQPDHHAHGRAGAATDYLWYTMRSPTTTSSTMPTTLMSTGTSSPKVLRAELPRTTSTHSPVPAPMASAAT